MSSGEPDKYLLELRAYIGETLASGPDGVPDEEPLIGGLLDSIALLTLSTHIEERYGIAVGAHDVGPENFGTLRALASFVRRKAGGA